MLNQLLRISQQWKIPVMMLIVLDTQSPWGPFFFLFPFFFASLCYIQETAWSAEKITSFQCPRTSPWQERITSQSPSAAVVRSPSPHLHRGLTARVEGSEEDMKDTIKHAASELSLVPAECKVLSEIQLNLILRCSVLPTGKVILLTCCGSQLHTNNAVGKNRGEKSTAGFFFLHSELAVALYHSNSHQKVWHKNDNVCFCKENGNYKPKSCWNLFLIGICNLNICIISVRTLYFTLVKALKTRQRLRHTVGWAGVAHSCSTGLTLFVTLYTVALLSR